MPPSEPAVAIRTTCSRAECGSNSSLVSDQNPDSSSAPNAAMWM